MPLFFAMRHIMDRGLGEFSMKRTPLQACPTSNNTGSNDTASDCQSIIRSPSPIFSYPT